MLQSLTLDTDPEAYLELHRMLDEPVADAGLTDRELDLRQRTRSVVAHDVAPRAAETDRTGRFAHESYQPLVAAGLGGILFPRHLGGSADTTVAYAVIMEEIAAGCGATSLVYMTQTHAAYPILVAGSPQLQTHYVPGLLRGTAYGSMAITEPDAGSDVSGLATVATTDAGGYRLSGAKTFITTGDRADVIVCFATTDRSAGRAGISAFVIEGTWPGVSRGRPFQKLGMNGSSTAEIFLDDVPVPVSHRLGSEGEGWSLVMRSVVKSRISAAAQGVGLAKSAYARALLALRRLHGARLPDQTLATLAELRGRILQGRLLLHAVARQVDTDSDVSPGQIGLMKQSCTDLGWHVADASTRLLGTYGDLEVLGIERCLRDARVTQIYDGTNEIQRMLIGREITRAMDGLR
ncbi:acyl-CoA dehydrogenase family protein [Cryptosporangium sp. NPDC051539]|uniref:acyl-CoA dehydrogenase family protein n=1 Tax=Cryptosporangium sp. NPDC051539 TaxID=3363962 RepID=UPI0037A4E848